MNDLFTLFISLGLVSFGIWKKEKIDTTSSESDISPEISLASIHLSNFVSKIELNKFCDPRRIFVLFTVDTAGIVSDSDFKILKNYLEDDCKPDSFYMEQLKADFVKTISRWELVDFN